MMPSVAVENLCSVMRELPINKGECREDARLLKISLIVPTLDEEEAIGKVLTDVPRDLVDELIVVDGSSDATALIAQSLGARVVPEGRKGYGRALQSGIENSDGDILIYIDGDGSYDARDIRNIVEPILNDECDVVLGNRFNQRMQCGAMPLLNRVGNHALSLVFSFFFVKRVHDSQCGLRAIRRGLLACKSYDDFGMSYVTEQLIKLVREHARVRSVPVAYRPRVGRTKLSLWTDGFKILKVILRERLRRSLA
jgi:glycosyltransferase involved in cell wall biosynthesis